MKQKPILVLLLLFLSTFVFAQLEKGNIFVQGSSKIGFSSEKYTYTSGGTSTESSKSTHFGFSPKAGYFVMDNLPVGLAINLSTNKTKAISGSNESHYTDFTIGPFVRYYFLPQDKLKPMAEISAGFGTSKDKSTNSGYSYESKSGVLEFSIGAGASCFVTDHIAFDMLIAYNSTKYSLKSESNSSGVKSTTATDSSDKYAGIGINLGVVVTIP
jgi:outer membrane protein